MPPCRRSSSAWLFPFWAWCSARSCRASARCRTRIPTATAIDLKGAPLASPLARILFGVYVALVVYASLYPLAGWRDHGLPLLAYLSAPWPRFVTGFDVTANFLGYVPYGFLCVAALNPRVQGGGALGIATLSGLALSLVLEGAQSYLPTRVAAGLDVLCNVAGAALGALAGLALVQQLFEEGPFRRLRAAFTPGV